MLYIYFIQFKILKIIETKDKEKKIIFTFWEPHEKIPGYLILCIKTWKKFLPDYEIKILDYKRVMVFLGETLFSKIVCKNLNLPIQVDAIRVALLKKFGGIWMDPDTIILNGEFLKEFQDFELIMLGDENTKTQNNNSIVINEWLKQIIKKVKLYNETIMKAESNHTNETIKKTHVIWNYLGNGIVDNILKNVSDKQFLRLNRSKMNALPETKLFEGSKLKPIQKYQQLYFQKRDPQIILNDSKSIILLHNSWTPFKYKTMSETDFLNQEILLSKLLTHILNK